MTTLLHTPRLPRPDSGSRPWSARPQVQLVAQQVEAIERFNRARRQVEQAEAAADYSREMRMDSGRRLEVLRRQHEAVVARTEQQLADTGRPVPETPPTRVLLAHRNEWLLDRVSAGLRDAGLHVVARFDNGADVIGAAVAEQPDLLLVEDTLAMVPGVEVVREVLRYCPGTRVVAQVAYSDGIGTMLDAGAAAAHTRRVTPVEIAESMQLLVGA